MTCYGTRGQRLILQKGFACCWRTRPGCLFSSVVTTLTLRNISHTFCLGVIELLAFSADAIRSATEEAHCGVEGLVLGVGTRRGNFDSGRGVFCAGGVCVVVIGGMLTSRSVSGISRRIMIRKPRVKKHRLDVSPQSESQMFRKGRRDKPTRSVCFKRGRHDFVWRAFCILPHPKQHLRTLNRAFALIHRTYRV